MRVMNWILCLLVLSVIALSCWWRWSWRDSGQSSEAPARAARTDRSLSQPVVGNPDVLQLRYEQWKESLEEGASPYQIGLRARSGHAGLSSGATGLVEVDFEAQRIAAHLDGLETEAALDLWLVDGADHQGEAEAEAKLRIGTLLRTGDEAELEADLSGRLSSRFVLDGVIVALAGEDPSDAGVLFGSPGLFQRLYALEQQWARENSELPAQPRGGFLAMAVPFLPQSGGVPTGFPNVFSDLVTEGEDVFFNETFDGNDRTCGTCHPAANNFTIEPDFIATLPNTDPLFVAETIPALIFKNPANLDDDGNPQRFENPALMRAFGLIVENLDGMGDLENRFTMRSVPHNIGMRVSIETPDDGLTPPDDRTGWSGDGAPTGVLINGMPTSGRLRDFTVGAVIQHFPLRPQRVVGVDMRLPAVGELDAVEAFLLSLGRQVELELRDGQSNTLVLNDPGAETGKELFRDGIPPEGSFTCQNCHGNAGANVLPGGFLPPGNRNFNTGVELFLQNRINDPNFTVLGEPRPVDGGFGLNPDGTFEGLKPQPGFENENFGDMTFNTVSLVEAADSGPFFHNNILASLEDTVRFYNTKEFEIATGGLSIPFNPTQVTQVANFMRVINALDNIESLAARYARKAIQAIEMDVNDDDVINRLLSLAIADSTDAQEVLDEGGLHNTGGLSVNAVKQLDKAKNRFQQAMNVNKPDAVRIEKIFEGIEHLRLAVGIMRAFP